MTASLGGYPTPRPVRAVIEPAGCIGCAKCLPACPVDAILGARQFLHAVLPGACTGCGLCLPPCPTNCISLVPVALGFKWPETPTDDTAEADDFLTAQAQMEDERRARKALRERARQEPPGLVYVSPPSDPDDLRRALDAALDRARKPRSRPANGSSA